MFFNSELQKIRKVFYKYDIRLKQNKNQKQHAPENTEYEIIILDKYGMIDLKISNIKYKKIKRIFDLTCKNGLLNKNKFKKMIERLDHARKN